MGLGATENKDLLAKYKENEIKNGRCAPPLLCLLLSKHCLWSFPVVPQGFPRLFLVNTSKHSQNPFRMNCFWANMAIRQIVGFTHKRFSCMGPYYFRWCQRWSCVPHQDAVTPVQPGQTWASAIIED